MGIRPLLLIVAGSTLCDSAVAGDRQKSFDALWKIWHRETTRTCRTNHLTWIADGSFDDILGDFIHTLPENTQKRIAEIADYSRRCANETAGFSCEFAVHLDAFDRLGLLHRFVAFACQHYKCTEPALCTKDGL